MIDVYFVSESTEETSVNVAEEMQKNLPPFFFSPRVVTMVGTEGKVGSRM